MIGALVTRDADELGRLVYERAQKVLADRGLWVEIPDKKAAFRRRWFHFNEDTESIRTWFSETLATLNFRAHVCYSERSIGLDDEDTLVAMYYVVITNIARRYASSEVRLIFEENPALNPLYPRILGEVKDSLKTHGYSLDRMSGMIGRKPMGGLSAVDYVLAFSEAHLASMQENHRVLPFQRARFQSVGPHLAHLIDFDKAMHRHRSGILL